MKTVVFTASVFSLLFTLGVSADRAFVSDAFPTPDGELVITFIGHGTLMMDCGGKIVHVDPWSRLADYSRLPDADLILVTHEHRDHLDNKAISEVRRKNTVILANPAAARSIEGSLEMKNGERQTVIGLSVDAVPAYNILHHRPDGTLYHPRGSGNGYILVFGGKRIYIAGDTEDIPEMKDVGPVDIAFLPVNLPYTMTIEMAANAARTIGPKVLYPYHFGETRIEKLVDMLKDEPDIEVRIRSMK
jgi:L-ascorbate metabolism protein UlaG (beta-lactamase superfamily)